MANVVRENHFLLFLLLIIVSTIVTNFLFIFLRFTFQWKNF